MAAFLSLWMSMPAALAVSPGSADAGVRPLLPAQEPQPGSFAAAGRDGLRGAGNGVGEVSSAAPGAAFSQLAGSGRLDGPQRSFQPALQGDAVIAVPEVNTLTLLLTGLAVVAFVALRRGISPKR